MTHRRLLCLVSPLVVMCLAVASCAGVKSGGAAGAAGASGAAGIGNQAGSGAAGVGNQGGSGIFVAVDGGATPVAPRDCLDLECQQTTCRAGQCLAASCGAGEPETTLSGVISDPAGKVPLYNVALYVPNAALDPIKEGVTCEQCAGTSSGHPIASAITDAAGHFVLKNPPVGKNVPLVIQVGKWRREVTVPEIAACRDNVLSDPSLARLPRTQSEGHIPLIAVTTGHADALECLLRKIGIADQEFTTNTGGGRVHLYVGGSGDDGQGANSFMSGATLPNASTLWGSADELMKYDMLVLSCEGSTFPKAKTPYLANVKSYADHGGRIFDDHLHFYWLQKGPAPWPTTAGWLGDKGDLGSILGKVDTTFPKGVAFGDWLVNVGASTTKGQLDIVMAQHSVGADAKPVSQRWIYLDDPAAVQYLTFNTPVEAAPTAQCGRVVFTDIHVSSTAAGGDVSHPETPFPSGCTTTTLSPQEKALEFMFFDLSSCVQQDVEPPAPPYIIP
jgi:hypothetical protein